MGAWEAFGVVKEPVRAVGPEGLEPSPRWLRARDAAANTWIPSPFMPPRANEKGQGSGRHLACGGSPARVRVSVPQGIDGQRTGQKAGLLRHVRPVAIPMKGHGRL